MNTKKTFGYGLIAVVLTLAFTACEQPTVSTTAKTLTGITLNTDSVKKAYIQNETLNLAGLVVTANYSDGSKAAVANYTADPASGATLSTTGSTTVTVSYTEETVTKTADFSVTVTAKALSGITANYTGTATIYSFTLLDSLKDHLTVTAQYNDGSEQPVTEYTLGGTLTAGASSAITVTYEGKTATFNVIVSSATLSSIAVTFNQNTATIYTSTPLDNLKQYLTVTATYSDNSQAPLSAHEYTLSGELTAGTPTITVNYGDKIGNFTPTVTAVVLTGITAQYATATIYTSTPSDNLKQYLTVKASYNDGNEKTLSANEYELSGTLTAGTSTITASYTEDSVTKTATFTVTVTAVVLVSITANYTGGNVEINSDIDNLKTALTVTAHYNDSSTQTASNYSLSGAVNAIGQKTITASYTDDGVTKTATFIVTVVCSNHDWQWTPTKAATPTEDGEETATCSICGTTGTTTRFSGEYATGTAGLDFDLISINSGTNNAYRVHNKNTSNGTATGAIVIPAYYRPNVSSPYLPVTEIGNGTNSDTSNAFGGSYNSSGGWATPNTTVTSITFAEGSQLTTIRDYAFAYCTNLTSAAIPASVTSIGNYAFAGITSSPMTITSVTIPTSVTSIGDGTFQSCTSLASITIPTGVTSIGNYAFAGCTSLTSITIPAGVTSIGQYAFQNVGLTGITIPVSVTSIGTNAFRGCANLTSITVDANNQNYASEGGVLYNKAKTTLIQAPEGISGNVTIPASVTSIGTAFISCTSLTSVIFAANSQLTSLGVSTFQDCTSLTSVMLPASLTSISTSTFSGCANLASVTIPGNLTVTDTGKPFNNCPNIQTVAFAEGTVSIANIFDTVGITRGNITSVYIPSSVTSITTGVFNGCTNLRNIVIDTDKVTQYNGSAFPTATNNWGTIFPADNLSVTFKKNVGDYAFRFSSANSTKLTSVTFAEGVTSIGQYAFQNCTGLAGNINIPAGVTTIGNYAFQNCTGLTGTLNIPASVTSIGSMTFQSCTGLTSITANSANTNYASEGGILYDKTKTTLILAPGGISGSVTIPASVTSIGVNAFSGCASLTSVTIPTSVTSIGGAAFGYCTSLASITIPASVTSIGQYAFISCTNLTSVTFAGTIASSSFNNSTGEYSAFPGDLRDKFYATNSTNGTPGTYTRPNGTSTTWTKQ